MMLRSFTGEIHLSSGLKRATVWLHSGGIDQVFSGPISGVKGLERILTWQNVTWKYREGSYSRPEDSSLKMQPTEFSIFAEHVQRTWERLVASAPPPNIVLTVDPARFSKMTSISPNQAMTLGAVSEFQLVRDILNYCPLPDLEILENLVAFRKSGLIRILK